MMKLFSTALLSAFALANEDIFDHSIWTGVKEEKEEVFNDETIELLNQWIAELNMRADALEATLNDDGV